MESGISAKVDRDASEADFLGREVDDDFKVILDELFRGAVDEEEDLFASARESACNDRFDTNSPDNASS